MPDPEAVSIQSALEDLLGKLDPRQLKVNVTPLVQETPTA
jgi:hypothetical protein